MMLCAESATLTRLWNQTCLPLSKPGKVLETTDKTLLMRSQSQRLQLAPGHEHHRLLPTPCRELKQFGSFQRPMNWVSRTLDPSFLWENSQAALDCNSIQELTTFTGIPLYNSYVAVISSSLPSPREQVSLNKPQPSLSCVQVENRLWTLGETVNFRSSYKLK